MTKLISIIVPIKLVINLANTKNNHRIFFHIMNTYIYILTDCNRTCLHVGMSGDLTKAINSYKSLSGFCFDARSKITRLVYHESLPTEETALTRFQEVSKYTRMQKERLIRRYNPDWVDLGTRLPNDLSLLPTITPFRMKLSHLTSL